MHVWDPLQVKAQNAYPPAPQWIKNGEVIRMLVYGDSVDSAQVLDACREAFFRGIPVGSPACDGDLFSEEKHRITG